MDTIEENIAEYEPHGAEFLKSTRQGRDDSARNNRAKKDCVCKGSGGHLVRDGVCLSLKELLVAVDSREMILSVRKSYGRMLVQLPEKEGLRPFSKCITACSLIDRRHLCDRSIGITLVKS